MSLNCKNNNNNHLNINEEQLTIKSSASYIKPYLIIYPRSISSFRNYNHFKHDQNNTITSSNIHSDNQNKTSLYQEMFSQRNSITLNNNKNMSKTIYDRSKDFIQSKQNKIKSLQLKLNELENSKYPFIPQLSLTSNNFVKDKNEQCKYTQPYKDFYMKNIQWKEKKEKSLQEKVIDFQKKDFEDCSFHPCINYKSCYENLKKEFKLKGGRLTYDKQIKWKQKLTEDKIRIEKENEKKRRGNKIEYLKKKGNNKKKSLISIELDLSTLEEERNKEIKKRLKEKEKGMLKSKDNISFNNIKMKNEMNSLRRGFKELRLSLEENKLMRK